MVDIFRVCEVCSSVIVSVCFGLMDAWIPVYLRRDSVFSQILYNAVSVDIRADCNRVELIHMSTVFVDVGFNTLQMDIIKEK